MGWHKWSSERIKTSTKESKFRDYTKTKINDKAWRWIHSNVPYDIGYKMTLTKLPGHCIDSIARQDPEAHRLVRALNRSCRDAIVYDIPYRSELVCFFKKCALFMLQDDAIWKLSIETQNNNFINLQAASHNPALLQSDILSTSAYFRGLLKALTTRCHVMYHEIGEKNVLFLTYKNHDSCFVLTSNLPSQVNSSPTIRYQYTWHEAMDEIEKALPSSVLFGKHYLVHMQYLYHPDYTHAYQHPPVLTDASCYEYTLHTFLKRELEQAFHTSITEVTLCMPSLPKYNIHTPDALPTIERPIVMLHRWSLPFAFTFVIRIYDLSVLVWQVAPPPRFPISV